MALEKKQTAFTVDEELCIACGICVDALLPMHILAIEEDMCIMTDQSKCLQVMVPAVRVSVRMLGSSFRG